MRGRFVVLLACVSVVSLPAPQSLAEVRYHVRLLDDLPGGRECNYPQAINQLGQVTGDSYVSRSAEPYLWDPWTGISGLGTLPGSQGGSTGYGVDILGHLAGDSGPQAGV